MNTVLKIVTLLVLTKGVKDGKVWSRGSAKRMVKDALSTDATTIPMEEVVCAENMMVEDAVSTDATTFPIQEVVCAKNMLHKQFHLYDYAWDGVSICLLCIQLA